MTGEWLIRKRNQYQQRKARRVNPYPLDELREYALGSVADLQRPVYEIRPFRGDGGVREAMDLLDSMHKVERSWFRNVSKSNFYEMDFHDEELVFRLTPTPGVTGDEFRDQLYEDYPNSTVRELVDPKPGFLHEEYDYVAAADGRFHRDAHLPFRHVDVDGFAYSSNGDARDPYKKVLTKLTSDAKSSVCLQIAYRPITTGLRFRHRAKTKARSLESGGYRWFLWNRPAQDHELESAEVVRGQLTESLYQLAVRVVGAGKTAEDARHRVIAAARAISEYYESSLHQGIYFVPVGSRFPGMGRTPAKRFLGDVAGRKATYKGMTATTSELAGLVHIPEETVQNPAIVWSTTQAGNPVPPRTPRFDFEALEQVEDPSTLSLKELFALMVQHGHEQPGETDDAIWLGHGTREGTEAGIPAEKLLHLALNGETGYGKSKQALAIFFQFILRGHGAMYFDPKDGEDAMLACALAIIAGRGEDLVPIRVGADAEHQISFNFLEVPGEAEPGTTDYLDKLEPMADVIEGVLAQAGGTGRESWGERMSGLTRHIVRGIAQLDLEAPATLMTLNYAGATETDRNRYAEYVNQQNVPFIEDTAEGMFAEYDDKEIEPWARRLNQVVESAPLRDIACNPDGVSLTDIIREGKIPVVFGETASNTALKMLGTALFPSLWTVKQELAHSSAPEDQQIPPFHCFIDELNDIVTPRMDLPQMLSNARSYDFHIHGIYQDPSSQTSDEVTAAFEGQATTLSVNPGTEDFAKDVAAHHSEDVGAQELLDLPEFREYIRTHDTYGERTESYPVNLGHPVVDIEEGPDGGKEITSIIDEAPSLGDVRGEIERLERTLGHERRDPDQVKADDPFAGTPEQSESESDDTPLEFTEATERASVQAVWDTMLRQDAESVPIDDVLPALRRRLEHFDGDAGQAWRKVLQHVRDRWLDVTDDRVRATNPRSAIAPVGKGESEGGITHSSLLWDAYGPLTTAGLDVTINTSGGATADAIAEPIPDPAEPELVDRLTDGGEVRIEAESTTGDEQPGVTAHHICQAAEEGRRVLVLTRPDKAHRVANTLRNDPPLCNSGESTDNETWYYTSTAPISFSGNEVYRPGGNRNVWVREHSSGDIVLRDTSGTEHARFEEAGDVFSGPEPYPSGGENRVIAPVIPEAYDIDTDSPADEATIVEVPNGASDLADLSIERYPTESDASATGGVTSEDLDVPDGAVELFELVAEQDQAVTVTEAHDLATEHGIDAARRTVKDWIDRLVDQDALREGDYRQREGREYEVAE